MCLTQRMAQWEELVCFNKYLFGTDFLPGESGNKTLFLVSAMH